MHSRGHRNKSLPATTVRARLKVVWATVLVIWLIWSSLMRDSAGATLLPFAPLSSNRWSNHRVADISLMSPKTSNALLPPNLTYAAPSYIIYVNNGVCYAKNEKTGAVDFSGSDTSTVIGNAIDTLANGGEILLKAGTFTLTSCIASWNRDGIVLTGEGRSTILKMKDGANDDVIRLGSGGGVDNWRIRDLAIDGNKANCPYSREGVAIGYGDGVSCNDIVLENLYIHDCDQFGVVISHGAAGSPVCSNVWVVNSEVKDCAWNGITLGPYAEDCFVVGNTVSGSSDVGITCYGSRNTISNNLVENISGNDGAANTHIGIALEALADKENRDNTIYGNAVSDCENGIEIMSVTSIKYNNISANHVSNCWIGGIWIGGNCHHNLIEGNTVLNCKRYQIFLAGSNCTIVNNNLSVLSSEVTVDQWGGIIQCVGYSNEILANNLRYDGNMKLGGILIATANKNRVGGNDIAGMAWNGIGLESGSDGNVIENNRITGSGEHAVSIQDQDCNNNVIRNNYFMNSGRGDLFDQGTGTVILGNTSQLSTTTTATTGTSTTVTSTGSTSTTTTTSSDTTTLTTTSYPTTSTGVLTSQSSTTSTTVTGTSTTYQTTTSGTTTSATTTPVATQVTSTSGTTIFTTTTQTTSRTTTSSETSTLTSVQPTSTTTSSTSMSYTLTSGSTTQQTTTAASTTSSFTSTTSQTTYLTQSSGTTVTSVSTTPVTSSTTTSSTSTSHSSTSIFTSGILTTTTTSTLSSASTTSSSLTSTSSSMTTTTSFTTSSFTSYQTTSSTSNGSGKGTCRLVLDASPKTGLANKPVTISGTLYGSWNRIKDGTVVGKQVEISTSWGFKATITTDNHGQFSISTNCPSVGGTYVITATSYEDQDLAESSATITYQVSATIATRFSGLSYSNTGHSQKISGRLETVSGEGLSGMLIDVRYYVRHMTYDTGWYTTTIKTDNRGFFSFELNQYTTNVQLSFTGTSLYDGASTSLEIL